jgi:RNA polymerase sigma-70 factor (ECF subfamily)
LPENFRTLVLLVDVEGLTYREAAEALDVPIGTVMSRLSRGRGLLRLELVRHAPESSTGARSATDLSAQRRARS